MTKRFLAALFVLSLLISAPAHGTSQQSWRASTRHLFSIGQQDGPAEYTLSDVRGVARFSNGDFAVVAGSEVRVYDAAGRHRRTTGRSGRGPGEFQMIVSLFITAADSLVVWDSRLRRLSVLDADGRYVRSAPLDLSGLSRERLAFETPKLMPGGTLLGNGWNPTLEQSASRRGLVRSISISVILNPVSDSLIILGEYGGSRQFYGDGLPPTIQPASPQYHEAVGKDRVAVGSSEGPHIDVFTATGRKLFTVRLATNPPRLTRTMRDRLRQQALESSAAPPVLIERMWSAVPFPERLPFFSGLFLDEEGRLWVRGPALLRSDSPSWDIYGSNGEHVARLELPRGFVPMWSDGTVVAGVWKDALDVEHVRAYTIERR